MTYVERVLDDLKKRNPGETEFHQTATEILLTLEPVINAPPPATMAGNGGTHCG